MRFNYSKIKVIANLPYKKFRTNCPRFNQNHSYKYHTRVPAIISKENQDFLNYLIENYSRYVQELAISHFNNSIWENHSQTFISIRSLTLYSIGMS
jgi:hypothetical protein